MVSSYHAGLVATLLILLHAYISYNNVLSIALYIASTKRAHLFIVSFISIATLSGQYIHSRPCRGISM